MTHQAATEAAEASRLCDQEFDKHPWVKTLKQYRAGAVARLIALYTDVFNDSNRRLSWPARPLAELWAQSVQSQRSARDGDIGLNRFYSRGSALHYMLYIMRCYMQSSGHKWRIIRSPYWRLLASSLTLTVSADRQNKDSEVVVWHVWNSTHYSGTIWRSGAKVLLEVAAETCQWTGLLVRRSWELQQTMKLKRTGHTDEIWKLLMDQLGRI